MLRLLGLECRTARSSIYSKKPEIKSPRELLLPGSAGILARMGLCGKENAPGGQKQAGMPALPGLRLTSLLSAL